MPELDWDLTEFVEVLEVLPQSEEYGTEHRFCVGKDGMRLEVSVWPHESVVSIDLYREGISHPVISHALFVRGSAERVKDRGGEYLRLRDSVVAPSRFSYLDFEEGLHDTESTPCGLTVRLAVNPQIRVEYER